MSSTKRYCKTLQLEDDPKLIEEYINLHKPENAWPEISAGMKEVGILEMEIYLKGTSLFMIMELDEKVDHDSAMNKLNTLPRQKEWEMFVSRFQKTSSTNSANEKWVLMDRIYKLE